MMTTCARRELIIASTFFGLAVALGAFGAHGLKIYLSDKAMHTYQTGILYQFLHAIALFIVSFIGSYYHIRIQRSFWTFVLGIIFFSFNCYIYAISDIKIFAMLIPLGGIFFIIGWLLLIIKLFKSEPK